MITFLEILKWYLAIGLIFSLLLRAGVWLSNKCAGKIPGVERIDCLEDWMYVCCIFIWPVVLVVYFKSR